MKHAAMIRTAVASMLALCLLSIGCSRHHGFDLANRSDQTITIDIIDTVDGARAPARQAVLGPGGHYMENIECRTPGLARSVRIGVADDQSVATVFIDLEPNLIEQADITVENGRIVLTDRPK